MAEINKNDIISEEAIQAPLRLAENLEKILIPLDKIITNGKKIEAAIGGSKSISDLAKQTENLTKSQTDLDRLQKDISARSIQRNKDEVKSLEDLIAKRNSLRQAIKNEQSSLKEDHQLLKQGIITRAEYKKRVLESSVAIAEYQQKIIQLNQSVKNEILLNKTVGNEYKQLTIQLERARMEYKNLAASGTASTEVLRRQQQVVTSLNQKVQAIDNVVGQFQRNVGNYPATFSAAARGLTSFLAAFGVFTGVALFARTLKGVIDLTIEYEYRNSQLQAILGKTASQTRDLRDQQQALGATTVFTSAQVAEMQIELAKLGFTTTEIKDLTESTLDAAVAMGSGLGEQAALTGAALKAFRLPATQAARVNDVLAKSVSSSALSFEKLQTALPIVAPVAAAFNFTIEETTALLGELSNAGFGATQAATATRNIFLNLADSSSKLSKRLKEPVTNLPSLLRGLKQLNNEGIDLGEAFELTDKRSVAAFATFLAGTDSVERLKTILDGAAGSAKQMANVMKDNLRGDLLLAKSAWEGLVLAITEGDSAFSRFARAVVQGTTALLRFLTPQKSATEELVKEQIEINVLVNSIKKENISREAKKQLIDELNRKYPEFLGNIDAENAGAEVLEKRLAEVNDQYQKKILLRSAEAALQEVSDKIIATIDQEAELTKQLNELKEQSTKIDKRGLDTSGALFSATDSNAKAQLVIDGLIKKSQEERADLQQELTDRLKAYQDALKLSGITATDAENEITKVVKKANEEREKQTNKLLEFQLERNIKYSESVKDRVFNEIALELFKKQELLNNEKLTQDERAAIIEESMQRVKEIQLKGFLDSNADVLKKTKELGQKLIDETDQRLKLEVQKIQKAAIEGVITREEAEKKITRVKKDLADEQVQAQITAVEKILELETISSELRGQLETELFNLKVKLTEAYYDAVEENGKSNLEKVQEFLKTTQKVYQEFYNGIQALGDLFTANQLADLDAQQRAFRRTTDAQLKAAGDNDKAKEAIQLNAARREEELEKKKIELQRRAAKFNKAAALTQSIINVAQAVTAALTAGPIIGQVLAILTAAAGAIQIAAIANAPLPQYKDGTLSAAGGASLVSEAGSELVKTPSGRNFLTPVRPTVMDIPKGSQVIPHEETMRMLAYSALGEQVQLQNENRKFYEYNQQLKETIKDGNKKIVKAIRTSAPNVVRQGSEIHQWITDDNGNKKKIRGKSIS